MNVQVNQGAACAFTHQRASIGRVKPGDGSALWIGWQGKG
jgi:hypothetical protein